MGLRHRDSAVEGAAATATGAFGEGFLVHRIAFVGWLPPTRYSRQFLNAALYIRDRL